MLLILNFAILEEEAYFSKLVVFKLNQFVFFFKLIFTASFIYLFIYGCVGSSFLCEGFLQLRRAGATLHRGAPASLVAEHRLQTRRLSRCGSRAQSLRGVWDPPRPGLEPVSPALAGRFSTTAPPGKPNSSFKEGFIHIFPGASGTFRCCQSLLKILPLFSVCLLPVVAVLSL